MSHFSTIRTELRHRKPLLEALRDLGFQPGENAQPVRGYRGQTVMADLTISPCSGGDIGFRWNASVNAYELVTDLDLWRQPIPIERFLARLTQHYALHAVLTATEQEGFTLTSQSKARDGSIELVVTRWDA